MDWGFEGIRGSCIADRAGRKTLCHGLEKLCIQISYSPGGTAPSSAGATASRSATAGSL